MAMNRQAVVTNVRRAFRTKFVDLNSTLVFISDTASIGTAKKLYTNIIDVGNDFADTSEFYNIANAYFAKGADRLWVKPMDKTSILASAGVLTTITMDQLYVDALILISDGEFSIDIDGTDTDIAGVDFTLDTDLLSIAQTLSGAIAGVTVSVSTLGANLLFTSDTTGATSSVNDIHVSSAPSGTDISAYIAKQSTVAGLDSTSDFDVIKELQDMENDATDGFEFICVLMDNDISEADEVVSGNLSKYVFEREYLLVVQVYDISAVTGANPTILNTRAFYDGLSGLELLSNGNVAMIYTDDKSDAVASGYVGELMSYDIGMRAPKFIKPIHSSPITLTGTELDALLASNVNVYTGTNERIGRAFIKEGTTMMDGVYIDSTLGGLWMKVQLENAIYDLLETYPVPMNIDGYTLLESVVLPVFKRGVEQGIINAFGLGETTFRGDTKSTSVEGYAIKFRAGDVAHREVIGQYCYYDNIKAHFVTNEVCIKMIEDNQGVI